MRYDTRTTTENLPTRAAMRPRRNRRVEIRTARRTETGR